MKMGTGTVILLSSLVVVGVLTVFYQGKLHKRQKLSSNPKIRKYDSSRCKIESTSSTAQNTLINQVAARDTFLHNINNFSDLLPSLIDGSYTDSNKREAWDDRIIDINDKNLISLWKLIRKDEMSVRRVLAQWGLSVDNCKSFQCMDFHNEMYETSDRLPIVIGKTYEVVSPVWILTSHGNSIRKSIIKKGLVK